MKIMTDRRFNQLVAESNAKTAEMALKLGYQLAALKIHQVTGLELAIKQIEVILQKEEESGF